MLLGKEWSNGTTVGFVGFMVGAEDGRVLGTERVIRPCVLVPAPVVAIQLLEECWVADVELMRTDADNGTVGAVQLCNLGRVLPAANHVIVGLIPARDARQLGAWERSEWVEEETVEDKRSIVCYDGAGTHWPTNERRHQMLGRTDGRTDKRTDRQPVVQAGSEDGQDLRV